MQEKISHGITFQGLISTSGLIICITAIIAIVLGKLLFLAIPAWIFGVVLFLSIRGVLIDCESMRIKSFLDILVWKTGNWRNLSEFDRIVLKLFNESQTMNMASISNTYTTRTFDVCLQGENARDTLLKEFANYAEAKAFLEKYSIELKIQPIDLIALILEERDKKLHLNNSLK